MTNPMPKTRALPLLAALLLGSCSKTGITMEDNPMPIACIPSALTPQQRAREAELLQEHLSSIKERREREDGYSFRYAPDPGLFQRIAELVTLEHQCCPFLTFQLEWQGADEAPWLHILGGARIKPFVAATFGEAPSVQ